MRFFFLWTPADQIGMLTGVERKWLGGRARLRELTVRGSPGPSQAGCREGGVKIFTANPVNMTIEECGHIVLLSLCI